jgi:hypothetical protein
MDALPSAGAQGGRNTSCRCEEGLTNDSEIRKALKENLAAAFRADPETLILEELGLRHGATRVDIVVVNGFLHGFEVKSDRDTLKRLARQVRMYSEILDYVTLVVGRRHARKAEPAVPCWWGIQVAEHGRDGQLQLLDVRRPSENPSPDKVAIAKLLWRDEALAFLEELGSADGLRSKPRRTIYGRLAEVVPLDGLRARVRHQLKSRTDWRPDEQRKSCGG